MSITKPLTQQELQVKLRKVGFPLGTPAIHACVRAKMPGVIWIPGLKKPRFNWEAFWTALLASRELDPLVQDVRDSLYLKTSKRRTG